jgi:small subunit ribosomal protein S18
MRSLAPKIRSKPLRKALVSPPNSQVRPYDPFLALGIDPTNEYLNGRMLSAFVTPVGRIKTRAENGLLPRSQRRVRKAIKRAQAMGLMGRWNNLDGLGEKRPVAREGHGLGRDWSLVDGGREPKIDQKQ